MSKQLEIRFPSVFRLMSELGRLQVTRLVAQSLWDRRGGEEGNLRDWFDAEKINCAEFWDDLQGLVVRHDPASALRAVQHILYWREEFSRVIRVPDDTLAAPLIEFVPLTGQPLAPGASGEYRSWLALVPREMSLGLETNLAVMSPVEYRAVGVTASVDSVVDYAGSPVALQCFTPDLGGVFSFPDVGTTDTPEAVRERPDSQRCTVQAGEVRPGRYLVRLWAHMQLTMLIRPVEAYPRPDDAGERKVNTVLDTLVQVPITVA